MDRIEKLTLDLITEQDTVTHYNESSATVGAIGRGERIALMQAAQSRRAACARQIADEWGEMVEALELSLEWIDAGCDGLHETATFAEKAAAQRIKGTLERVKGRQAH